MNNIPLSIFEIARICHQGNKAYCELGGSPDQRQHGDYSQVDWDDAPPYIRDSAIQGVKFRIANNHGGYQAQHEAWRSHRTEDGWVYGAVKDAKLKTHPCLVPWSDLPLQQQVKDRLFCAIVDALYVR